MSELGAGSGTSYPTSLDTDNNQEVNSPNVGKTRARAEVINDLAAAIIALETELGTSPKGTAANVKTFLQTQHNLDGTHKTISTDTLSATGQITSTLASGTAPLVVTSPTKVTNLNADLLDGYHEATINTASTIVRRDASGDFAAGTITALTGFIGNITGNVTGNTSGSSGSCTGNSATATSATQLNGYHVTGSQAFTLDNNSSGLVASGTTGGYALFGFNTTTAGIDVYYNSTNGNIYAYNSSGNQVSFTLTWLILA